MKNDRNVKQVSRLTGALLARKGSAAPSHETNSIDRQDMNGFLEDAIETAKQLNLRQNSVVHGEKQFATIEKPGRSSKAEPVKADKGKVSSKKSKSAKSSKAYAVNKRIAMTLRMEEENHLNLRIYSAHTRKSCQVILSEALELYLSVNNDKVPSLKSASQNR